MFYVYFQGERCVRMVSGDYTLWIMPTQAHLDQIQAIDLVIDQNNFVSQERNGFGIVCDQNKTYCIVTIDDKKLLYDNGIVDDMIQDDVIQEVDLAMVSLQRGLQKAIDLIATIKTKKTIPLDGDPEQSIEFCRHVMYNQLAIPKYLNPGQYLVF